MRNKYGAKKTTRQVNGVTVSFDSLAEARRYDVLYIMARSGEITNLTLQPKYELQSKYEHEGKSVLPIYYIADFRYTHHGFTVVEDVKGMLTDVYRLKKKLFLYRYGTELVFREVK